MCWFHVMANVRKNLQNKDRLVPVHLHDGINKDIALLHYSISNEDF